MAAFLTVFLCAGLAQLLLLFAFAFDGTWLSLLALAAAIALFAH